MPLQQTGADGWIDASRRACLDQRLQPQDRWPHRPNLRPAQATSSAIEEGRVARGWDARITLGGLISSISPVALVGFGNAEVGRQSVDRQFLQNRGVVVRR